MITNWTIENFKSVYKRTTLEFAPLTIFSGANSSGKSTVIQSVLLTAQTLQSPVPTRPVVLNGHVVRLGQFNDIVSGGDEKAQIHVGFRLRPSNEDVAEASATFVRRQSRYAGGLTSIEAEYVFSTKGAEDQKEVLQLQPSLDETRVKTSGGDDKKEGEEILIRKAHKSIQERLTEFGIEQSQKRAALDSLEYEIVKGGASVHRVRRYYRVPRTGKPIGASLTHFLPDRVCLVYDAVEEEAGQLVSTFLSIDELRYREIDRDESAVFSTEFKEILVRAYHEFLTQLKANDPSYARLASLVDSIETDPSSANLRRFYTSLAAADRAALAQKLASYTNELKDAIRGGRLPQNTLTLAPLSEHTEAALEYVQRYFTRLVKYLGPLRDEPKPVYPLAGATDPKDIGFRGEHTAAVLETHRKMIVNYIPSDVFGHDSLEPRVEQRTLLDSVLDWLGYLGVAQGVKTLDLGKLGHELKVATIGSPSLHDLTHVGVGVSQVLPILVLSLLSDRGSTLIFEQPELHLNPRVQTRLADFFVAMTMLDKQCVVETHSEYLINRLRYLTAISHGDEISAKTVIYFAEKDKDQSKYRAIKINRLGVIEDWPLGFFDDNERNSEATLLAAMRKRNKGAERK